VIGSIVAAPRPGRSFVVSVLAVWFYFLVRYHICYVLLLQVRVKCNEDDTIKDLKMLASAQLGTKAEKIQIKKWCVETAIVVYFYTLFRKDF